MSLPDTIIAQIRKDGLLSFRDFMELALYHPASGYYTSSPDAIGQTGDYYTSPEMTPAFGATLGIQMEEMWRKLGEGEFTIVEYGAGTGSLCHGLLDYLKQYNAKLYDRVHYYIIEKSLQMREKEKAQLTEKVSWIDSIYELPKFSGCVISNELVDNFAVHRVVMQDQLMEVFVGHSGHFKEELKPASGELCDYLNQLKVVLPQGFCTEINMEARNWMQDISARLSRGFVVTIDYGHPSFELYNEFRNKGTLACYYKHKANNRFYDNIGSQDITSHVNFSALCLWGANSGLEYSGYTDQGKFLQNLGFSQFLQNLIQPDRNLKNLKQYLLLTQTLLMDMGSKFKVLVQHKGLPKQYLSGLKY